MLRIQFCRGLRRGIGTASRFRSHSLHTSGSVCGQIPPEGSGEGTPLGDSESGYGFTNTQAIMLWHEHRKETLSPDRQGWTVMPGEVITKGRNVVPSTIRRPPYAQPEAGGDPGPGPVEAEEKDAETLDAMRVAGKLARQALEIAHQTVQPGVTTEQIDAAVHDFAIANDAYPSPLEYRRFPKSVCTSVNDVACHGIPDDRVLRDGDIVNVDVSLFVGEHHGDCSATFAVGEIDDAAKRLIETTHQCLWEAIESCGPGIPYSTIGEVIVPLAGREGFSVSPYFLGHGIGSYFHGPPQIYHVPTEGGGVMKPGHVFTIEPILHEDSNEIFIWKDGWTAQSIDGGRSAQEEHMIAITEEGYQVLTLLKREQNTVYF
eukprot:Clim_evm19s235 gene=Clim_evmTU19s235